MYKQPFNNLGQGASRFVGQQMQIPRRSYGVRIGADSELDQCFLVLGGTVPAYNGVTNIFAVADGAPTRILAGCDMSPDVFKLSVERPFIGLMEAGQNINVFASRAFNEASAGNGPRLSLEFLDDPIELGFIPTKRAPLDIDATLTCDQDRSLTIVIAGRKYIWVDLENRSAVGATVLLNLHRFAWDQDSGLIRVITANVAPATVVASNADFAWEGNGEADVLQISFTPASATAKAVVHVRAED